jgi:hypothetical protein
MATVYLARQSGLQRDVALKELSLFDGSDPEPARRFLREARLAGSFSHPSIVTVHDYFEDRGAPYIAMEYMAAGSLRPHVGRLTLAQVGGVLEGVLGGLAHAEEHRVVHRDLKPENIMVSSQGRVKIADFGIAKATSSEQTHANLTTTGTTLGTPRYMAPERAMGQEIGPWSDLYSVGIMVFEMLVGRTPFYDTDAPMAILMRQVNEAIPPVASLLPDVDRGLSDWVGRLLVKDPAGRMRAAAPAWDELDEILTALLGPRWANDARLPAPGSPAPRARRGRPPRDARTSRAAVPAEADRPSGATVAPLTVPLPPDAPRSRWPRVPSRGRVMAVAAVVVIAGAALTSGRREIPRETDRAAAITPARPAEGRAEALGDLRRRTRAHRRALAAASTLAAKGAAMRTLAVDYDRASRRLERLDARANRRVVAALDTTAAGYRDAAVATARGDGGAYETARSRAEDGQAAVADAEADRRSAGDDAGSRDAQPPGSAGEESGIGDSRSDDPSDDEPDEEEGADGA